MSTTAITAHGPIVTPAATPWISVETSTELPPGELEVWLVGQEDLRFSVVHRRTMLPNIPPDAIVLSSTLWDLLRPSRPDSLVACTRHAIEVAVRQRPPEPGISRTGGVAISREVAKALGLEAEDAIGLAPPTCARNQGNFVLRVHAIIDPVEAGQPYFVELESGLLGPFDHGSARAFAGETCPSTTFNTLLRHPGYCWTSPHIMANVEPGATVRLSSGTGASTLAQVLALPDGVTGSDAAIWLEPAVARHLAIDGDSPSLSIVPDAARLLFCVALPLDKLRSKARLSVGFSEAAMTQFGYESSQPLMLHADREVLTVSVQPPQDRIPPYAIGVAPLITRRSGAQRGWGVFVAPDPTPFVKTKVGILNIEELGQYRAYGTPHFGHLTATNPTIEVVNVTKATSLDIDLEIESSPRTSPLIRLPRVARQILAVESRDEIVVRGVLSPDQPRGVRARLRRRGHQLIRSFLQAFVDSRRVQLSIAPGMAWDDHERIARVSAQQLSILGVDEGDYIRLTYRGRSITRIVLTFEGGQVNDPGSSEDQASRSIVPAQLQVSLDAPGRWALSDGAVDFGTVIDVERDMMFILRKSLHLTVVPLLGTVIAMVTLMSTQPVWLQIGLSLLLLMGFFYLELSTQRARVK